MAGQNAQTYLSRLDSAFSDDPVSFQAFRLAVSSGSMTWAVDGVTLTVDSSALGTYTVDLEAASLQDVVEGLIGAGFVVGEYDTANADLSAAVLIDGTGSVNDPLLGYSSFWWAIGEAIGVELEAAGIASDAAIADATLATATEVWLDLWGSYFGVVRNKNEADEDYALRIVVEVIRPRCNNVAIGMALSEVFGQDVGVVDTFEWGGASPDHSGTIDFDGTHTHNSSAQALYGLFDVTIGYDLLSGADPITYLVIVRSIVDRLRAAGTYLRNLTLTGSTITDVVTPAVDGAMKLSVTVPLTDAVDPAGDPTLAVNADVDLGADAVAPSSDGLTLTIVYASLLHHDGRINFDGSFQHNSGATVVETL